VTITEKPKKKSNKHTPQKKDEKRKKKKKVQSVSFPENSRQQPNRAEHKLFPTCNLSMGRSLTASDLAQGRV